MKTRKQILAERVAELSKLTGKTLAITTHTPGGSGTYYRIVEILTPGTGQHEIGQSCRISEMEKATGIALQVAYLMESK
jgi:hypothetical protein